MSESKSPLFVPVPLLSYRLYNVEDENESPESDFVYDTDVYLVDDNTEYSNDNFCSKKPPHFCSLV